jgi:DNA-binding Lrp family transcriptional regulator
MDTARNPATAATSVALDAFDLQLLALVQADSRLPQSALGAAVHLSTAAVNRRLKRLTQAGVIERFTAVLAPDALGYGLTLVAEVEAESERIDLLDAMKKTFRACPQVQQCYYVTGEWDFILIFNVRDMAQYTALTRQLFFQSNNVKRFRTLVAMDRVKVGLDVPLG